MADDLLARLERGVRRFGGPLPIDDLLPELDAGADVHLTASEPVADDSDAAAEVAAESSLPDPAE